MARRRNKGQEKRIARDRVQALLDQARSEALGPDADLAARHAGLAVRVAKRYQIPLRPVRRIVCVACGAVRTPQTSRTRIHRGRVITTCTCGHIRRRPL